MSEPIIPMSTDLEYASGCGCYKVKNAAWFACAEHAALHPGGWDSPEAYRAAWAHVQCCVCARYGFNGEDDFDSVGFAGIACRNRNGSLFIPLLYAHTLCSPLGRVFRDMQFHPDYVREFHQRDR